MERARDPRVREALHLARAGEKEQARRLLIELLRQNRDDFDAWVVMAQVTGDQKEAAFCMRQALRLRPDDERAQRFLSHLLQDEPQADSVPTTTPLRSSHWLWIGLSTALIICLAAALILFLRPQMQNGQLGLMSDAQPIANQPADCSALINQALEVSDQGCQQIGRNQVCYGHNTVQAQLVPGADAHFDKPGSIIPINILESFIASPLDMQKDNWGIGVFRLEANLPGTLPGQMVTMLVFGNTTLQNTSGDMQAFYFTSSLGGIRCDAVPFDGILVRMAEDAGFAFKANGTNITLQGNSVLRAIANDNLKVTALSGIARVGAFGQEQLLGPGQTTTVPLGGADGLDANGPPAPPEIDDTVIDASCTLTGQGCPAGDEIAEQVSTNTPVPVDPSRPTNTPVPIDPKRPTNTPVPVLPGQPTNTSVPLATNTPEPLATNTAVPISAATSTVSSNASTKTPKPGAAATIQPTATKTTAPPPTATTPPPTATTLPTPDLPTVCLFKSDGTTGIQGGVVRYYKGGWQSFGTTGSNGCVSSDIPDGSYTFGMTYLGGYVELTQNIGANPTVVFRTVNVAVRLRSSTDSPLDTGMVRYYAGGWLDFGSTSGGQVSKELLPRSYTFGMTYLGGYIELTQDVGASPTVVFQTMNVAVQLTSSTGSPLDTGTVRYYAGGWLDFGSTAGGQVSKELLPRSYTFGMTYESGYMELAQDVGANPTVVFRTAGVVVQLRSSTGSPLDTGMVKYYAGGWRDLGSTAGGQVSKELLPRSYTFGMTYEGGYIELAQDVSANPTVVFQTVNVVVQLRSSTSSPLDTGMVKYYAGGWRDFGSTSGGQVGKELLPRSYTFGMTYVGGYKELAQDVSLSSTIIFQTGQVISDTSTCTMYYAGGWQTFITSGMELLPNTYTFRFSDGTAETQYTIAGGNVNHIH